MILSNGIIFIYRFGQGIKEFGERMGRVRLFGVPVLLPFCGVVIGLGRAIRNSVIDRAERNQGEGGVDKRVCLPGGIRVYKMLGLNIYELFVEGIPKAQPRPRMAANRHVYNPPSADAWKEQIKASFMKSNWSVITGPAALKVYFYMPWPKGMKVDKKRDTFICKPHAKKPDLDNLLKAVMDAMTAAKVWQDDAQVFMVETYKWYIPHGGTPGARIIIETRF